MSPQKPQPPSVDYTGAALSVGQSVAFIEAGQDSPNDPHLYTGEIKLIGTEQIVVQSGEELFIVKGREVSHPRAYRFWTVKGLSSAPDEK
ncbi:hypothetical protein [Streptomyces africanus]|uniref:hypothetical protein n=1 Tax=Streptomyces africanus TaxID=231024 RepID=UPI000A3D37C4|nr:hypothetical protein [Streptomyces africanus]